MEKRRSYGYDNLRALLIFCVVFAHLLEILGGTSLGLRDPLYFVIYCFHIPALIFLNGVFSRFSWNRAAWLGLLYLLFQAVYRIFAWQILGKPLQTQLHIPYWHLWYLMSYLFYLLAEPILARIPVKYGWVPLVLTIFLSLWAGYENAIGYAWSASRTLVFLPYFVLGHYAGRRRKRLQRWLNRHKTLWSWLLTAALAFSTALYFSGTVTKKMLYGSYSYAIGYGPLWRLLFFAIGCLWIFALLALFLTKLDRKLPGISTAGQNTLSVFLLHGFLVRILGKMGGLSGNYLLAFLLAVLMLAAFGNPWMGRVFRQR